MTVDRDEKFKKAADAAASAYSDLLAVILLLAEDAKTAAAIGTRVAPGERDAVALAAIFARADLILRKYRRGPQERAQ